MIEYRAFHNTDPPQLLELWNFARLGPGAAVGFSNDALDMLVLSEPYFDKQGLIVACEGKEIVGFVHAGFGSNSGGTAISSDQGVISVVIVQPDYRRRGIGRALVSRAEGYLRERGATAIFAGESGRRDPFYLGLYGGAECAGFLESDLNAAPFFGALGYEPAERYVLMSRDITERKDPFDPRAVQIKRQTKFGVMDHPPNPTWWWMTRHGRFESLTFALVPNAGGAPPALVTCWGMELHAAARGRRTVGLTDLWVSESERRKGYGRVLVSEVIRRLREDLVSYVEATVSETNTGAIGLFEKLGFVPLDRGVVYRRRDDDRR